MGASSAGEPRWSYLAPPSAAGPRAQRPTCSIVIAAHNCAAFIGEAIESALDQSSPPLEVIVCDDGSSDDLDAALEPFLPRIRFIRQRQLGEGAARNTAIRQARGEFVAVLDGDDRYHRDRIDALMAVASYRSDLDIITTDIEVFGPAAHTHWRSPEAFAIEDQRGELLRRNFIPAPAFSRRRWAQVGGYNESLAYAPDWELYARMVAAGATVALVPEPLYHYRLWSGQLSSDRLRANEGRLTVLDLHARRSDLTEVERAALAISIRNARIERWRTLCATSAPSVRTESVTLARDPHVAPAVRAKAVVAALAPSLFGRVARLRRRRSARGR